MQSYLVMRLKGSLSFHLSNNYERIVNLGGSMNENIIKRGFIAAACVNFSVLVFSKGFTNSAINNADPVVMSNFGLMMIVMWGLTYLAAIKQYPHIKWLAGVFAIEKMIYGLVWINWIFKNNLESLYSTDLLAGLFFSTYGASDLIFMLFFGWVFLTCHRE